MKAAEKRGFTPMRDAQLYLSMVTVSKSKGECLDPAASRVADLMIACAGVRRQERGGTL